MKPLKLLNLYAGIGGNRKLWTDVEITSVELDPTIAEVYKNYFPDDNLIVGDAHQYLLDHYKEFDFIWSSPPCTTHTRMNKNFAKTKNGIGQINPRYPDMKLYQEIIFLDNFFKGKYCVENVIPYYTPLIPAQQRYRHLYWCNFKIRTTSKGNPEKESNVVKKEIRLAGKTKSYIKEDSAKHLAKKFGFAPIEKNIYVNGNHSPRARCSVIVLIQKRVYLSLTAHVVLLREIPCRHHYLISLSILYFQFPFFLSLLFVVKMRFLGWKVDGNRTEKSGNTTKPDSGAATQFPAVSPKKAEFPPYFPRNLRGKKR